MRRKVIQLAGKTLLVSLPTKWAKQAGIQKGDEIEATEKGRTITFNPVGCSVANSVSIDVTGAGLMIKRIIASLYKAGVEEVFVKYSTSDELRKIREVLSETCLGYEMISDKGKTVSIKSITSIDTKQYELLLRKSWMTALTMSEDVITGYTGDKSVLESVVVADMTVNRFTDFCRRTLNKDSLVSKKPLQEYVVVEMLEKIADVYKDIAHVLSGRPKDDVKKILSESSAIFRILYELFYKFDLDKLVEFRKRKDKFDKLVDESIKLKGADVRVVMLAQKAVELCYDLNGVLIGRELG